MKAVQEKLERLLSSLHEGKALTAVLTIHEDGNGAKQFTASHFPREKKEEVSPEPAKE